MSKQDPAVDEFVRRAERWRPEIRKLRRVLLGCGLDEALKWGKPCYAHRGRNVAIVQPFAAHCALMFFQGALLDDPRDLLRSQGANTRSAKRLEFTAAKEIDETVVRAFVEQAVAVAASGRQVEPPAEDALELPDELAQALRTDRALARAFRALTPGRRRSHALHVGNAVQSKTRAARVDKCRPKILAGQGWNER